MSWVIPKPTKPIPGLRDIPGYPYLPRGSFSQMSTMEMVALFNSTPISWRSKCQLTTALSTAEAEYMGLSASATEMIYLRRLCTVLLTPMRRPTPIGKDNSWCIEWTNT